MMNKSQIHQHLHLRLTWTIEGSSIPLSQHLAVNSKMQQGNFFSCLWGISSYMCSQLIIIHHNILYQHQSTWSYTWVSSDYLFLSTKKKTTRQTPQDSYHRTSVERVADYATFNHHTCVHNCWRNSLTFHLLNTRTLNK